MNQSEAPKDVVFDKNIPIWGFMSEATMAGNHRFRVVVAGATLELLITTLIKHHCKKHAGEFIRYTYGRKLSLLHEMGILTDKRYELLKNFKELRNDAAHDHNFEITNETLSKFPITITTDREDRKVFHICAKMVFELWNEHRDVLATYFRG